MKTYISRGGRRVVILGSHPMKDYILIGSGVDDDASFVPYSWFIQNFVEEV